MRRSLPQQPCGALAPEDRSGEFGGLADVLEPVEPALHRSHEAHACVAAQLSRTGPSAALDASVVYGRAPAQVQDFAFADTVVARELPADDVAPPSGPIFVNDPVGHTQCMTPLAFPLPPATDDAEVGTRLRLFVSRTRHGVRRSVEELLELWSQTAEIVVGQHAERVAVGAARPNVTAIELFARRLVALFASWQWERADLARAAIIGTAVFVVAAAAGTAVLVAPADAAATATAEVRGPRTLEQHTAKRTVVHAKARATDSR